MRGNHRHVGRGNRRDHLHGDHYRGRQRGSDGDRARTDRGQSGGGRSRLTGGEAGAARVSRTRSDYESEPATMAAAIRTSSAEACRLASALSNGPAQRSPNWPAGLAALASTESALATMNDG